MSAIYDRRWILPIAGILLLSSNALPALSGDPNFGMGVKLYRTQHYKEANRCFDQSLSKHSKNPTANYYKAITLQQMGDTESAEQVYRRIVKNYPRTPEARLSAGVVAKLEAMKNPAAKADTAQPSVQHVQNVRSVGGSKSATPVPKNSGRTAK